MCVCCECAPTVSTLVKNVVWGWVGKATPHYNTKAVAAMSCRTDIVGGGIFFFFDDIIMFSFRGWLVIKLICVGILKYFERFHSTALVTRCAV